MASVVSSQIDLGGLIDMHLHTGPDVRPRKLDDIETARAAAQAGLAGILIKSHVTITADRAAIAEKMVPGIRVFGGVALNHEVGGLNPAAVETALKLGARQVWMPTFSAQGLANIPGGITILDEFQALKREVLEIIKLVAEKDVVLGTGHLSLEEIALLVGEARRMGAKKILVTHPDGRLVGMPVGMQRELAAAGAFFERTYESALGAPELGVAGLAQHIREVGPTSTVISSDMGQLENPLPVDGFRTYIAGLLEAGISGDEVQLMAAANPAKLLGI